MSAATSSTTSAVERLVAATNRHDLDDLVACFHPAFVNETPAHPARSFAGREQVRRNWSQIFDAVPDLKADVVRKAIDGDTAWLEWEFRGSRLDGSPHHMRGITVFGVEQGEMVWVRFYVEPVDNTGPSIELAIREHLGQ